MFAIYVKHDGNLYELAYDVTGDLIHAQVSYDNNNYRPEPIDRQFLPAKVLSEAGNQLVRKYKIHPDHES